MHLESYHNVLKSRFLERKCNWGLDFVLHVLIDKVPHFYLTRQIANANLASAPSYKLSILHDRHKKSEQMLASNLNKINDGTVVVDSATNGIKYTVE